MSQAPSCGALFAGIGGFCFGFEKAGFKTSWSTDIDEAATQTYKLNFPDVPVFQQDIRTLNINGVINLPPIDVLHAGFPCQSFSMAGNRDGFKDHRGRLFFEIIRVLESYGRERPKVVLLENSPYIKIGDSGSWFDKIRISLNKAGYWFSPRNAVIADLAKHYGYPQTRERLFMIAVDKKIFSANPVFVPPKVKAKTLLKNIVKFGEKDEDFFLDTQNKHYQMLTQEYSEKAVESSHPQLIQLRRKMVRLQSPGKCPTLTANMGGGGHNVPFLMDNNRLRKLTESECLHLQGFDRNMKWPEIIRSKKYKLIGNSVAPIVSEGIAKFIKSQILENRQLRIT